MQKATSQLSVRLVLFFAMVCAVFLTLGGSADAGGTTTFDHVVAPGETVWEIASSNAEPGADVRRLVRDIARLNGLDDGVIHPGQVLQVPQDS